VAKAFTTASDHALHGNQDAHDESDESHEVDAEVLDSDNVGYAIVVVCKPTAGWRSALA